RIGGLVAERAKAFGMRLVGYDPYITQARAAQMGVEVLDLPGLLDVSDFVTVHMPKTPETIGMISTEEFKAAKPAARLINVARGARQQGGSTGEAQEKAGVAVAWSVRKALAGELVPDAVNVAGGAIHEDVRPGIPLAERLARAVHALADSSVTHFKVEVNGEIADKDVSVLKLSALKGLFKDVVSDQVSYVNAPLLAEE